MRGGTSRALIFHERDLPARPADGGLSAWNDLFCDAIGSPDPYRRQLNGMGGGITSLSKVAVVGPPTHPDADVDYTFGQVDVTSRKVGYRGNCGNISSAIGPFAVDEGLVAAAGAQAIVVIHNTNTRKLIRAAFSLDGGKAAVQGDFVLDGVAGTGSPIELAFLEPGGAVTGKLFPTGRVIDYLNVPELGQIEATMVDACNPVVFVAAGSIGLTGSEPSDALAGNARALELFREIRIAAAVAMGIVRTPEEARTSLVNIPFVALVSRPVNPAASIATRMVSSDQPHKASPLTGAMCLAVAASIEGTVPARVCGVGSRDAAKLVVEHASGLLPVAARITADGVHSVAHEAIVYRTARRLMEGRVFLPS
jgi:2-methylaconitate cis-trans-isomerase PrpF